MVRTLMRSRLRPPRGRPPRASRSARARRRSARHELLDEPWDVGARRPREGADAGRGLDLDAPGARELCRRPGRDDLTREQDRDAVADELDLGEQVRVQEDGDAAAAQALEQLAD